MGTVVALEGSKQLANSPPPERNHQRDTIREVLLDNWEVLQTLRPVPFFMITWQFGQAIAHNLDSTGNGKTAEPPKKLSPLEHPCVPAQYNHLCDTRSRIH
ncbi:hypothetical protein ABZX51_011329 [Aspergillus tubingensis]